MLASISVALAFASLLASAHPGANIEHEIQERSKYLASLESTSLARCAGKLASSGHVQRMVERRQRNLRHVRQKAGLDINSR